MSSCLALAIRSMCSQAESDDRPTNSCSHFIPLSLVLFSLLISLFSIKTPSRASPPAPATSPESPSAAPSARSPQPPSPAAARSHPARTAPPPRSLRSSSGWRRRPRSGSCAWQPGCPGPSSWCGEWNTKEWLSLAKHTTGYIRRGIFTERRRRGGAVSLRRKVGAVRCASAALVS